MIEAQNISFNIGGKTLIHPLSLTINCGEITAIIGQNGAGKSTLLKILSGQIIPSGNLIYNGTSFRHWRIKELARIRAVMNQSLEINFPFTVKEIIFMSRNLGESLRAPDLEIYREVINLLAIEHLQTHLYQNLSGGEKQKVQFAKTLFQIYQKDPLEDKYLFLDEPSSCLDLKQQYQLFKLLTELKNKFAICLIAHNINFTLPLVQKVIGLKNGHLVQYGDVNLINQKALSDLFDLEDACNHIPNTITAS
jgi:iron complex transport system ATP-binding protein